MRRGAPDRFGLLRSLGQLGYRNSARPNRMDRLALEPRRCAAEAAVREAGRIAAAFYARRSGLRIDRKGVQDLVSEADRACEDAIVAALSRAFPDDGFLGEEGGRRGGSGDALWVIDPIDGTHNFLTGIPFWCVSIALVVGGEAVLGVIFDPGADELF